jgi:hypothetical protein
MVYLIYILLLILLFIYINNIRLKDIAKLTGLAKLTDVANLAGVAKLDGFREGFKHIGESYIPDKNSTQKDKYGDVIKTTERDEKLLDVAEKSYDIVDNITEFVITTPFNIFNNGFNELIKLFKKFNKSVLNPIIKLIKDIWSLIINTIKSIFKQYKKVLKQGFLTKIIKNFFNILLKIPEAGLKIFVNAQESAMEYMADL